MSNDALTHPTDAPAIGHALTEAATTAGYAPSIHNLRHTDRRPVTGEPAEPQALEAITAAVTRTTVPGRDFGHSGDLAISADHDKAAVFVMLYGPADQARDWLRAGEALSAGWLTATEHGVSVLPHSAPIEVIGTRHAMRVILASTGYPYLVLRLGTIDPADAGPPHAPRLPTDQIIEQS